MMVAAAYQIGDQLGVGELVWSDGLQLPVRGNSGWFAMFVPIAKLLPPQLLRENLFGTFKSLGYFGLRGRQDLTIAEAVYVAHLQTVDEQPVEAGEVVGALLEGRGMSLLEVARHRARHVYGILRP
jgi:hypothetical protein